MALQVIGSGFGRTGTKSLKEAVEQLGFGPCHHMHEVLQHPGQVRHWQALAGGEAVVWDEVFDGYRSMVDWPGAQYWRELADAFPDAKVVHTVRPEDDWWSSFQRTIGKLVTNYRDMPLPPHARDMLEAWEAFAGEPEFGRVYDDREAALGAFRRRSEEVRDALPADRLLVFDVSEGWEPLCRFLEVDVPDTPFPRRNLRADFWDALGGEPA